MDITWTVGGDEPQPEKKLEYVSTWKVFSKLEESEKEKRSMKWRLN